MVNDVFAQKLRFDKSNPKKNIVLKIKPRTRVRWDLNAARGANLSTNKQLDFDTKNKPNARKRQISPLVTRINTTTTTPTRSRGEMGRPLTEKPSLLNSFCRCWCCGGGAQDGGADHVLQPLNLLNPGAQTSQMQLVQQSESARLRLFQKLGSLQEVVLTQSATSTAACSNRNDSYN